MINAFKMWIDNTKCRIFGDYGLRQFIYRLLLVFYVAEPSTAFRVLSCQAYNANLFQSPMHMMACINSCHIENIPNLACVFWHDVS